MSVWQKEISILIIFLQFWLLDTVENRGGVSSENTEEYLTKPLRESKLIIGFEIA